ncbi:MAG: cytochrome-c peroxidase [Planctomycetota bacterium]
MTKKVFPHLSLAIAAPEYGSLSAEAGRMPGSIRTIRTIRTKPHTPTSSLRTALVAQTSRVFALLTASVVLLAGCVSKGTSSVGFSDADGQAETRPGAPASIAAGDESDSTGFTPAMLDAMVWLPGDIGPLPPVPVPDDNPQTEAKIELGKLLFFDPRLSADQSISCSTCHAPNRGWADGRQLARGLGGKTLARHTPTILNTAYNPSQFWDGRSPSLEAQASELIMSSSAMNMETEDLLIERLRSIPEYLARFHDVFDRDPTLADVGKAIAAFERTVISGDSRFDQYARGDKSALTHDEKCGLILFFGKAQCTSCHNGPNLTDNKFHGLGVDDTVNHVDEGRFAVTRDENDRRAFKTPTLRNIADSAPFMHNGSLANLVDVINFYNDGGGPYNGLSELVTPLFLTDKEKRQLVLFLETLTGPVDAIAPFRLPGTNTMAQTVIDEISEPSPARQGPAETQEGD